MRLFWVAVATIWLLAVQPVFAQSPASSVRAVLSVPDAELSYVTAKLAFDRIVDPSIDEAKIATKIDSMAAQVRKLTGTRASDVDKLKAVRQVLYDGGAWNSNKPFSYDHEDPLGLDVRNKLLSTYFDKRRGNCVSMPVLHIILAEKLGLNVHLSTAPLHMLVRYTNPNTGRSLNIEPTSGGHPTRDIWYREKLFISDHQIVKGLYLQTLTKRETIAHMATSVMEWLMIEGRYREAIAVSEVIMEHYPKDAYTMVKQATAASEIMQRDFLQKYGSNGAQWPFGVGYKFQHWQEVNKFAYSKAVNLGWETPRR